MLNIAISPCPNDVYIFAGLILGEVSFAGSPLNFVYEDVETCNKLTIYSDKYDVAKISYANFTRIASRYQLLRCGGALGRGVGPLLLTNGAVFDAGREVLVPGEFTTANFLLDFYVQRPLTKRFVPFDVLYDELCNRPGTQGVVIHEKRFTYKRDGLTLAADLGEHYERATGMAIPLGAIVLKRELSPLRETLEQAIGNSLAWADGHKNMALDLCRKHAQEMSDAVMQAHIDLYVNDFSRDLGPDGQAAVDFFLHKQAQIATN